MIKKLIAIFALFSFVSSQGMNFQNLTSKSTANPNVAQPTWSKKQIQIQFQTQFQPKIQTQSKQVSVDTVIKSIEVFYANFSADVPNIGSITAVLRLLFSNTADMKDVCDKNNLKISKMIPLLETKFGPSSNSAFAVHFSGLELRKNDQDVGNAFAEAYNAEQTQNPDFLINNYTQLFADLMSKDSAKAFSVLGRLSASDLFCDLFGAIIDKTGDAGRRALDTFSVWASYSGDFTNVAGCGGDPVKSLL